MNNLSSIHFSTNYIANSNRLNYVDNIFLCIGKTSRYVFDSISCPVFKIILRIGLGHSMQWMCAIAIEIPTELQNSYGWDVQCCMIFLAMFFCIEFLQLLNCCVRIAWSSYLHRIEFYIFAIWCKTHCTLHTNLLKTEFLFILLLLRTMFEHS